MFNIVSEKPKTINAIRFLAMIKFLFFAVLLPAYSISFYFLFQTIHSVFHISTSALLLIAFSLSFLVIASMAFDRLARALYCFFCAFIKIDLSSLKKINQAIEQNSNSFSARYIVALKEQNREICKLEAICLLRKEKYLNKQNKKTLKNKEYLEELNKMKALTGIAN